MKSKKYSVSVYDVRSTMYKEVQNWAASVQEFKQWLFSKYPVHHIAFASIKEVERPFTFPI